MGVWVNVGARDESLSKNGISHLIEHMIFKGTDRRSAFEIAREFDSIGGHTNAFTAMENTCYYAKVFDVHTETMVDILSDIFLNSLFDAEEIEKECPVILQEIGMVEDNPDEYVHLLSGNTFWGDNPLGRSILGTRENITQFTASDLKSFFDRYYQSGRIVISAAGNVDHERFVDIVGQPFSKTAAGNSLPERVKPEVCSSINIQYRDIEQAHFCLSARGMSITDPERYTISLLSTILGGNMSSRLFQEIREKRGLAYSVYSFISSYMDTGMFGVYAGVAPHTAKETIELVLKEMRTLKHELITPTELKNAKEYIKGSLLLASESVDNQMLRLAQNEINFGYHITLNEVVEGIEAVSEDDINRLAENLFQQNQIALTMLGPIDDKKPFEDILAL